MINLVQPLVELGPGSCSEVLTLFFSTIGPVKREQFLDVHRYQHTMGRQPATTSTSGHANNEVPGAHTITHQSLSHSHLPHRYQTNPTTVFRIEAFYVPTTTRPEDADSQRAPLAHLNQSLPLIRYSSNSERSDL